MELAQNRNGLENEQAGHAELRSSVNQTNSLNVNIRENSMMMQPIQPTVQVTDNQSGNQLSGQNSQRNDALFPTNASSPQLGMRPSDDIEATIAAHNADAVQQIINVDPNYTPDGRRIAQNWTDKFLVKCFEDNMLLSKPNITTVAYIVVTTAFSVLICIAVSTEQPNLTIVIYGYWIDILVELIVLLVYVKASDLLLIKYSNWAIMPWLMKLIMVGSVSADLYRGTSFSIYISFLVILPVFFNTNPRFCYQRITLLGFVFSLILSIAELLVIIKLFTSAKFPVRAIFDYLYYFFIVMVFFTGLVFLVATCGILCHFCNQNRQYPIKLKISHWFYGVDTVFEILVCYYFANFIEYHDQYSKLKAASPLVDRPSLEYSFDQTQKYRRSLYPLMIATSIYVFVRMTLCFWLTYGLTPAQLNRNLQGAARSDNQPKVEKPGNASAVLNLFRINTNYFSAQAASTGEAGDKKPEGEDNCTICFSQLPNCIILDCKHGGICDNCAFDMMKKSSNCPFCRQAITKVCVVEKMSESQYRVVKEIKP